MISKELIKELLREYSWMFAYKSQSFQISSDVLCTSMQANGQACTGMSMHCLMSARAAFPRYADIHANLVCVHALACVHHLSVCVFFGAEPRHSFGRMPTAHAESVWSGTGRVGQSGSSSATCTADLCQ